MPDYLEKKISSVVHANNEKKTKKKYPGKTLETKSVHENIPGKKRGTFFHAPTATVSLVRAFIFLSLTTTISTNPTKLSACDTSCLGLPNRKGNIKSSATTSYSKLNIRINIFFPRKLKTKNERKGKKKPISSCNKLPRACERGGSSFSGATKECPKYK